MCSRMYVGRLIHTYIRSVSVLHDTYIVGFIRCDDTGTLCVSLGEVLVTPETTL